MNERLQKLFDDMRGSEPGSYDPEGAHGVWDELVEEYIIEQGGQEIIDWLRQQIRWYA